MINRIIRISSSPVTLTSRLQYVVKQPLRYISREETAWEMSVYFSLLESMCSTTSLRGCSRLESTSTVSS